MISIKKRELKKNKWFIFISFTIVLVFVIISMFLNGNYKLDVADLGNSSSKINKLIINEIMSSNGGSYSNEDGYICDWIEIYNGSNDNINLKNYGLSDKTKKIKWVFPEMIINSKQFIIINLCGENKEGLYAPFKLKSSGEETIALISNNGEILDAVETSMLDSNQTMGRDENGNWHTFDQITPGFENTKNGYTQYMNSLNGEQDDLKITEFLPKNDGNTLTNVGYIELKNESDKTISLKEYTLSNDIDITFKWQLPDIKLNSKETIVFYEKSSSSDDLNHMNFKLESNNGQIILGKKGKIIEKQDYSNLQNGLAKIKINDTFVESSIISPGYENDNEGIKKYNKTQEKIDGLIINEVMNNNTSYLIQNGDNTYDWIELKNNSKETINLSEYNLSTKNTKMYQLPNIELKPNEYYIIIASGDTNLSNTTYNHSNFKLSDTESIYLFKNEIIIDSVVINNIPINYSYGRGDYGFYYIETPTPLKENNSGTRDISVDPKISMNSGIYNDIEKIDITIDSPGTIYYTIDGSNPNTSSKVYNGPISLEKTAVLKVKAYEQKKLPSSTITNTYIINENHTIPVLSISLNPNQFNTLQSNAWSQLEYAAYAELYEKDSSFKIPCGLELFGGSTRGLPKKSFTIKFKKKYGESKLKYQVFDNRDFSEFDSLVLRSGSQDYNNAFIRDILGTSLVDEYTDVSVQAYKSIILYINGNYWGIYNIREKVDETFLSNNYSVSQEGSNIMRIDNNITVGSSSGYISLLNFVRNNDMSLSKNYEYIKTKVNIQNMIDYWIAELYVTNNDIVNCRFFWHKDIDNGKLHFIFYDLDYAWYNYTKNYYNFILDPNGMEEGFNLDTSFLRNMMKNEEFKKTFLERLSYNLKNTWKKENVLNKIDELYNNLLPEMERNKKRWGSSLSDWNESISNLKNYVNKREQYLLSSTKTQFNLSSAQMKEYFGE